MAHEMANSSDTERHESLVDVIRESWEWRGIEPVEVVGENDLGNLIIKDASEKHWRLRPEDCCCDVIATNLAALSQLSIDNPKGESTASKFLVFSAADTVNPTSPLRR